MATQRPLVVNNLGEAALIKPGDAIDPTHGGTGVNSLAQLKTALNLDNVENKSASAIINEITQQDIIDLGFSLEGGGGGAGVTYYNATVDFGVSCKDSKTFTIANASATTTKRVFVVAKPDSDEYEMDALICSGYCAVNGIVTIYITAVPGPVSGTRNITYWLG